jgi:hypothetical protein
MLNIVACHIAAAAAAGLSLLGQRSYKHDAADKLKHTPIAQYRLAGECGDRQHSIDARQA